MAADPSDFGPPPRSVRRDIGRLALAALLTRRDRRRPRRVFVGVTRADLRARRCRIVLWPRAGAGNARTATDLAEPLGSQLVGRRRATRRKRLT